MGVYGARKYMFIYYNLKNKINFPDSAMSLACELSAVPASVPTLSHDRP